MAKFSKVVLAHWLYLPRKEIRDIALMRERLTFVPKFNPEGTLYLFDDSKKDWLGVPRCSVSNPFMVADEVVDRRISGTLSRFKTFASTTPHFWPGQVKILDQFKKKLEEGKTGFILEAPPGSGKTCMMAKMMADIQERTLVVVPRSNLIDQWFERLIEHTNLKRKDIGVARDGKIEWKGKKVVVGLVHTVGLDRFGQDFRNQFGCIVFDEVDRAVPPATFAPVVSMFPAKYRIGASATIERTDGMHAVFEQHLGEVKLKGLGAKRMNPKVIKVMFRESSGGVPEKLGAMQRRGMLLSRLANNPIRNQLIARWVKSLYDSDRKTVVLSSRKQQLVFLREAVKKQGVPDRDIGFYCGSLPGKGKATKTRSAEANKRDASACKILLGTYEYMGIGTDIPELSGLVYATPQADTRQTKGRIERYVDDKKNPVIVDIVDTAYLDALRWSKERTKRYMLDKMIVQEVG